ncbi:hypothetical protein GCM10010406_52340 [Streptomyces thermolineatus]|uniref:Uncharacterized protein n=1 Tax=Streptomyces thermolineatus TaxID=44033 RepID=A0ABP6A2B1_9ACTN
MPVQQNANAKSPRPSARKVRTEVIASQGLETAQVVMTEGLTQAAEPGKKRPTASLPASVAKESDHACGSCTGGEVRSF